MNPTKCFSTIITRRPIFFFLFFWVFFFFDIVTNLFPPSDYDCSSAYHRPDSYSGAEELAATEDLTKGVEMAAASLINNSTSDSQAQKMPLYPQQFN